MSQLTQLAADNFDRADSATLGANWTAMTGTAGITSNQAGPLTFDGNGQSLQRYSAISWPADQYSEVTIITAGAAGSPGPAVRCSAAAATCYSANCNTSGGKLFRIVAGVGTQLGATFAAPVSGDKVRLEIIGVALSVYINGALVLTVNDPAIASGSAGINAGTVTTMRWDNWFGGSAASDGPPLVGRRSLPPGGPFGVAARQRKAPVPTEIVAPIMPETITVERRQIRPGSGPFLKAWLTRSKPISATVSPVGTATGSIGFSSSTVGLKGAIALQVGNIGLSDAQQSTTKRIGSGLGAIGLTDTEAGKKGALVTAAGAMGLSSSEAGAQGIIGSSVGRVGLSSAAAAAKGALETAIGRVGLSSIAVAVKGALEVHVGAIGLSGSEVGVGVTSSSKAGSGAGTVGMSSSVVALRGALETGAGRLGLSAAVATNRAAIGAATGAVGLSGSEAGGHVILGSAAGAVGLSGSFFAAAGAARDPVVLGGGFTSVRGGRRKAALGSARGAIGIAGRTRSVAVVREAATEVVEPIAVDIELRTELERFESESPAVPPAPREARGSARGTLTLVSFARGAGAATRLVEPVAPQRSVGFSAGSSFSSAGGGASGRGARGGLALGTLQLVGSTTGVGRVPEGSPVIDEGDLAIILYVLDEMDQWAA